MVDVTATGKGCGPAALHGAATEEVGHRRQLREQEVAGVVAAEVAPPRPDDDPVVGRHERAARALYATGDHRPVEFRDWCQSVTL